VPPKGYQRKPSRGHVLVRGTTTGLQRLVSRE
jgi:hypothetical protein